MPSRELDGAIVRCHPGGVRERPNRHAWKACVGQPTVGSNPTPSAMANPDRWPGSTARCTRHGCASPSTRPAALAHDDVPIGAVVVRDGEVIAARHNERELTGDPTAHAEVLALRDAAAVIGHWRLDDCTLVVTLEPCVMCAGAVVNGRIGRLVFGATDPKAGAVGSLFDLPTARLNHRPATAGVRADECGALLLAFFAARRRGDSQRSRNPLIRRSERRTSFVGRLHPRRHPNQARRLVEIEIAAAAAASVTRSGRRGVRWWRFDRGRIRSDRGDRALDREHDVVGHLSVVELRSRAVPCRCCLVAACRRAARRETARRSHPSAR